MDSASKVSLNSTDSDIEAVLNKKVIARYINNGEQRHSTNLYPAHDWFRWKQTLCTVSENSSSDSVMYRTTTQDDYQSYSCGSLDVGRSSIHFYIIHPLSIIDLCTHQSSHYPTIYQSSIYLSIHPLTLSLFLFYTYSSTWTRRRATDRSTTATVWSGLRRAVLMSSPPCPRSLPSRQSTSSRGNQVRRRR